jgi:cytoskeletal protein CcmA (bactofilin family)
MWHKDDQQNSPASGTPAARSAASPASDKAAYIGPSIVIDGKITGSDDLVIDGRVKGSIKLTDNALTIGSSGVVEADVEAKELRVEGKLVGASKALDRIEITKTGSVEGEVTTSRITVEDGAVFRGSVNIEKPDSGSSNRSSGRTTLNGRPSFH